MIEKGKITDNQQRALERAEVLKSQIQDYKEALQKMPTGFAQWSQTLERQERFKNFFKASDADWDKWRWQLKNRITSTAVLK